MFIEVPGRIWVALLVGAAVAAENSKRPTVAGRLQMFAISLGFGFVFYEEAAARANQPEVFAAVVVAAFGYPLFMVIAGLIGDQQFIRQVILARIGGGK